jgi:hypothetical protein
MRKPAAAGMAALIVTAVGAIALAAGAQPGANGAPVLNTGSSKYPQGVRLSTTFGWGGLSRSREPIVTGFDLWFPKGSQYNGARYPLCSESKLDRSGPSGCPAGAIMGSGTGTAYADTTITRPKITVVNGGAREVFFYVVMNNPARLREAVVGHISHTIGRFTYHLAVKIPKNLQIVAGVPIKLTSLQISAGRAKWLAINAPPAGIRVSTTYGTGFHTSYLVWEQAT